MDTRVELGGLGLCQEWDCRKMCHFRNFEKWPLESDCFDYFCHFMPHYIFLCNKIFNFSKNGRFFLPNHLNISKFMALVSPKMCHFSHFSNSMAPSALKNVPLQAQSGPQFYSCLIPIEYAHEVIILQNKNSKSRLIQLLIHQILLS